MEDYQKNMIICSVISARKLMKPKMGILTTAFVELGGTLAEDQQAFFETLGDDQKANHVSQVDTLELDDLVGASAIEKESRESKRLGQESKKAPFVRSTTPKGESRPNLVNRTPKEEAAEVPAE